METRKLNNACPEAWLTLVLLGLPDYKINGIDELMPLIWRHDKPETGFLPDGCDRDAGGEQPRTEGGCRGCEGTAGSGAQAGCASGGPGD